MPEIQNFTYTQLLQVIPSYMERRDAAFLEQLDTFIALAENRLATDMKQEGFQSVVKGNFPLEPAMAKPSFWRETISFTYKDSLGKIQPVELRSLEYVKAYWPQQSLQAPPVYYADYNISNFLLAPTPGVAYEFELAYYARLQPLSEDNETNWLTLNAPQTLLYAIMLEASLWSKTPDKIQTWQTQYAAATGSIMNENMERLADRNTVVTRA